jgi:hypothetical protein
LRVKYDVISNRIEQKSLPVVGIGTGRVVYDLGNGYVVKKARNRKGLAQNRAEYQIATRSRSDLLADVISVSDDYIYLIMKKADKVTSFDLVRSYYKVKNLRELFGLDKFYQLIKNNGLLLPDLYQKTSWGIINGKPVLIDFGFTKDVRRYYKLL